MGIANGSSRYNSDLNRSWRHINVRLQDIFKQILPETRRFDGCQGVTVCGNEGEEGQLVLVEEWESREHHNEYMT